jgi:60 kDa SS-A/Ro ribonucleoprotein
MVEGSPAISRRPQERFGDPGPFRFSLADRKASCYNLHKMTRYAAHVNERETPQHVKARPEQVQNSAGGYVFAVDKWARLDRFLVLGADGPTYYVGERELTIENAKIVSECLAEDGLRVVARIVEISDAGRAPKNDPAIFALAMAAGSGCPHAPDSALRTRKAALEALPKVCRIGTHLFHFANDVENFRGWGPALRKAVAAWYTSRDADRVAHDLVKYQSRDGWGHRDLIKLSHPKAPTAKHKAALAWSARGGVERMTDPTKRKKGGERGSKADREMLPRIIEAFIEIHSGVNAKRACELISEHRLPHECVPNELKNEPSIWEALSEHMGSTALMRNVNKMTAVGLLKSLSNTTTEICEKLCDPKELFKARVHPFSVLLAMRTYAQGHGEKGSLSWTPVRDVVDALDTAFYNSFESIEPTGMRTLLALDVSGSMGGSMIARTSVSAREASAAMAMATARVEKTWAAVAFTSNGYTHGNGRSMHHGYPAALSELSISPRQRLDDVVKHVSHLPMGGTDCALPMLYALERKIDVDCFIIYTDNETWAGNVHPFQALRMYRERTGIQAKLVVVGMTATGFSIADPSDAGMLDVVGFDTAAPAIIADFSANREVRV